MVRPAHAVAASLADNEMITSPISALGLCGCDDEALTPCPMLFVFPFPPSCSFVFFYLLDYASKQAQTNAYIKCYTQLDESRMSRKLNATQAKFVPNHGFKPPTFGCTTHIAPMKHPVAKSCTDDVYIYTHLGLISWRVVQVDAQMLQVPTQVSASCLPYACQQQHIRYANDSTGQNSTTTRSCAKKFSMSILVQSMHAFVQRF
jgi:hypothetical protein